MKLAKFSEDQALLLQVIEEHGEEEVESLAASLRLERSRLFNMLISLQRKGLIRIKSTGYGTVASLSRKGRKTTRLLWPDLPYVRYG